MSAVASPYQTYKTIQVNANKHYKHNQDGRTAPGVRGHGSVQLTSLRELDYNNVFFFVFFSDIKVLSFGKFFLLQKSC